MKLIGFCCVLLALLFFWGCSSAPVQTAPAGQPSKTEGQPGRLAGDGKTAPGQITEEELLRERQRAERERALAEAIRKAPLVDIFFDFDSYAVRQDDVQTLTTIGTWLKQYPQVRIVVEGHTDERGTTEYNLALGQKRAEGVKDFLVRIGVGQERMRTVSFGKEMPAVPGHDEGAWAKNRRVHFVVDEKR